MSVSQQLSVDYVLNSKHNRASNSHQLPRALLLDWVVDTVTALDLRQNAVGEMQTLPQ